MRFFGFAAFIAAAMAQPVAARDTVALTFDDLPALTQFASQNYVTESNRMLLRGLARHHLPAIGFVNEGKFDDLDHERQIDVLKMWLAAGIPLGNHTYSHESPNDMTARSYTNDIARGEKVTRALLAQHGLRLTWFRHPYLETGLPLAEKQQIDRWLTAHGYRIAPVTMENSDWLFAEPYDDAIKRHDVRQAAHIKASYLAYTATMMAWYRQAAHALLGRDFAFVMLLHSTRLNADTIDRLAAMLDANHLHPVTLETAMRDPAYRIPDPYVGPEGIEWLERWSMKLDRSLPWGDFVEPPADIEADYKRVDDDPVRAPRRTAQ